MMIGPSRPARPRRSKIILRDLGTRGVAEANHTSFRLDGEDRARLRALAAKRYADTGEKVTMSGVVRELIRRAHKEEIGE